MSPSPRRALAAITLLSACLAPALSQYLTQADLPSEPAERATVFGKWLVTPPDGFQGLQTINPFLTDDDLRYTKRGGDCDGRQMSEVCSELPSWFSGLGVSNRTVEDGIRFIGVTDGGPGSGCKEPPGTPDEVAHKDFVVPAFAPVVSEFRINMETNSLLLENHCFLKSSQGGPVSGLPNTDRNEVPFTGGDCKDQIDRSIDGLDPEEVQTISGTDLCLGVDEYSPSMFIFNCNFGSEECGTVLVRYIPDGLELPGAAYDVRPIIPGAFIHRRRGRGFESAAVSPDGNTAILILQSPMGNDADDSPFAPSHTMHAVKLDISNPVDAKVTGHFLYMGENVENWIDSDEPQDTRLGSATWASEFAATENDVLLVMERRKDQIKLFLADFSVATDVVANPLTANLTFDQMGLFDESMARLEEFGVVPAGKALILDTGNMKEDPLIEGWDSNSKQEGVAILNECVVAMADDNDFGIGGTGQATITVVQLAECIDSVFATLDGPGRKLLL